VFEELPENIVIYYFFGARRVVTERLFREVPRIGTVSKSIEINFQLVHYPSAVAIRV